MNKLVLLCFLSLFVRANEITFDSIEQTGKKEITISFKLEKVSLIRSYSLENPSRIVVEVNQSELKNNIDVPYKIFPRRKGDPESSYADISKAKKILNWKPEKNIQEMCLRSWNYQKDK